MYLIVGLGNPDKQYEKTFHNLGFIAAGDAAEALGAKFRKKECEASVAEAYAGGEKIIVARPLTYMNNSGRAVKQLMAKYKVPEDHLLVIYDDYDLPKGKVRIRAGGGPARITVCAVGSAKPDSRSFPASGSGSGTRKWKFPSSITSFRKCVSPIMNCLPRRAGKPEKPLRILRAARTSDR